VDELGLQRVFRTFHAAAPAFEAESRSHDAQVDG